MQAVILAAGRGTRMLPLTRTRSKAMLPILGVPIVEHVMSNIAACGIHEFIVVADPQDVELTNHFQRITQLDITVQIVHQSEQRGMAQALSCAVPYIRGNFLLSACDNLVPTESLAKLLHLWHVKQELNALLALMSVAPEQALGSAVVKLKGEWVTRIIEKPSPDEVLTDLASMPIYCFTPRLLDYLSQVKCSPRGEYELQDAIQMLIEGEGRVRGLTLPGRMTLTAPADLLAINQHYMLEKQVSGDPLQFEPKSVGADTRLIEPLWIGVDTNIGVGCTIGPLVYLEGDCTIGDHVCLREAIVLRGTAVPAQADIFRQVLSGS